MISNNLQLLLSSLNLHVHVAQVGVNLAVVFIGDLTGVFTPNLIAIHDQIISSREHSKDVVTFLNFVLKEVIQISRELDGAGGDTRVKTVGFTAGRKTESEVARDQTEVSARNTQESINLGGERVTELVGGAAILHASTSDDFSGKSDTHGVSNNVDFLGLGVLENSFSEVSQIGNILVRVSLLRSEHLVGGTPSSDVEFTGLVTLGQEVGDGVSKTVELVTFNTDGVITVTVEENNRFLGNFVLIVSFASVAATRDVSSVKVEASVAIILEPLLEVGSNGLGELSARGDSEEGEGEGKSEEEGFHREIKLIFIVIKNFKVFEMFGIRILIRLIFLFQDLNKFLN